MHGGVGDERPFQRIVDDRRAVPHLIEQLLQAFNGSHFGERAAHDFFGLQSEERRLALVESKVTIILDIEKREPDRRRPVKCFDFGVLAFGFVPLLLEFFL